MTTDQTTTLDPDEPVGSMSDLTAPQREILQAVADEKVTGMYHEPVEVEPGRAAGGYWSYHRCDSRRAVSSRIDAFLQRKLVSRDEFDRTIPLAYEPITSRHCRIVLTGSGQAALGGGSA